MNNSTFSNAQSFQSKIHYPRSIFFANFCDNEGGGLVHTMNDFALAKNLTFFNQQFFAQSSGRMSRVGGKI